jgi:hypothetical protein
MTAVPAGVIAERRVIDRLMQANAVSPEYAASLDGLRRLQARRLARLIEEGVVREPQPGRYYLEIPALAGHLNARRQRVKVALLLLMTAMAVLLYFASVNVRR